jgi:Dockerin type I domain
VELLNVEYTYVMKTSQKLFNRQALSVLTLGMVSIATSFAIGMHTTDSVQPFTLIEAGGNAVRGDINADTVVNQKDVLLILEMVAEYTPVTPEAYNADPNQDGKITIDDAITILQELRY